MPAVKLPVSSEHPRHKVQPQDKSSRKSLRHNTLGLTKVTGFPAP